MKKLSGTSGQKWLTATAILLLVLSLAGIVALQMSRNAAADKAALSRQAIDGATPSFASTQNDDKAKDEPKPLKVGSVARIGSDYSVSITDVAKYKGPSALFLVAKVEAKYTGDKKGDPTEDLVAKYSHPDLPTVVESACASDFGAPDLSVLNAPGHKTLTAGGVQTYAVCIALPADKVKAGRVSVETSDADARRASWTTTGAPTKVAPKPKPVGPAAGGKIHDPKGKKELEKQIKKAEKGKKKLEKLVKQAKKIPGFKKKKIKKVKKQIDELDDAIDKLKKLEKLYY